MPGLKVVSRVASELSRAMPLRLVPPPPPTLVKNPLTSSLPSGCTRIEKTLLSKTGLKVVSTPPDWARTGETEKGRTHRAIIHQRPVLMSLFTPDRFCHLTAPARKKWRRHSVTGRHSLFGGAFGTPGVARLRESGFVARSKWKRALSP